MIRGLCFVSTACGIALSASAGERTQSTPAARALATPMLPISLNFPGHDAALTIRGDSAVRMQTVPLPPKAVADIDKRLNARFDVATLPEEDADIDASYDADDLRSPQAWRVTGRLAPVTSRANGVYAVRDLLAEYRKPRGFRPSALSAMLVLRIDGKEESPPLSVGGGGVAAALWKVLPYGDATR
ncbi:MAG: hypothetical protein EOP61_39210 [Sphingomonadales bacterium]|nr:MAG: hypothetical protein EOP61_39210 [Sphingomonadales bacterium]